MNGTGAVAATAPPIATFERITKEFENGVDLAQQLATRSRLLVEKLIGVEPQPDSPEEEKSLSIALSDRLTQSAESLRVSLNEISDWITKLEASL